MRRIARVIRTEVMWAGMVLVFWSSAASASYEMQDLAGAYSRASDINDAGQVVGFVGMPGGDHAVLWEPPTMRLRDLGTLGGPESQAFRINDVGEIVGWSYIASPSPPYQNHAFLWDPATKVMQDLGTLGGWDSRALGINHAGQVVGESANSSGYLRAFLWDPATTVMQDLGTFGGVKSSASNINASGQVVGWSDTGECYPDCFHAFLWDPATKVMHDLGTLGGSWSYASDINDAGQVVGTSLTASGVSHAFLWDPTTKVMRDLGTMGENAWAIGINDLGQVVGESIVTTASGYASLAYVWDPATAVMQDIGSLGGSDSVAYAINHSGQVVGFSDVASVAHAFLATRVNYEFAGFVQPIEGPPAVNVVRAGAAVAVKWQLGDAQGDLVCDPALVTSVVAEEVLCDGTALENPVIVATQTTGQSGLRCDAGTFVYAWKTDRGWAGKCYALILSVQEGGTHEALFALR